MALQLILIMGLMFYMPEINVLSLKLLVFPVAIASQLLAIYFESMLKRQRGIKDSSNHYLFAMVFLIVLMALWLPCQYFLLSYSKLVRFRL